MYTFMLVLHIIIVVALLAAILIQRGRSGGLIEALGGVESLFGTKTSSFFVKITVVLAVLFFTSTITLAWLAKGRGKSLMGTYETTIDENTAAQKQTSLPDARAAAPQSAGEQKAETTAAAPSAENAAPANTNENQ
ncbi:MAG: preprotein translocase subunit SecG [Candidatus Omnitrophota bacterium]|nr:preprotein translocase subunit SecG [Candidatus Omnitrophota bacterium]